jgi:hypothetical protein
MAKVPREGFGERRSSGTLLRRGQFQEVGPGPEIVQDRRGVNDVQLARVPLVRFSDVLDHLGHDLCTEGVEKEQDGRHRRQDKGPGISAHQLDVLALLALAAEGEQVPLSDLVQFRRKLHANDLLERQFRGQQQRFAFARAEVDEEKLLVAQGNNADAALEFLRVNRIVGEAVFVNVADAAETVQGHKASSLHIVKPVKFTILFLLEAPTAAPGGAHLHNLLPDPAKPPLQRS